MRILLHLLALYLGGVPACAQTVGATHVLTRGPGAEAAALGNTVVPVVRDPSALYWNPAGLANAGGMMMGEHLFLYDGARYNFVGLSVPSRLGTFGLGALQLERGNIIARNAIDDPGSKVSNSQTDFLMGFARRVGEYFAAGGTANLLRFDLAGHKDIGLGVDLGGQAFTPSEDVWPLRQPFWSFGAVLKNLLQPEIKLDQEKETFPRELRGGLSVSFATVSRASLGSGVIRHDRAELSMSFRKVSGEPGLHPGLGLSYAYENMVVLRLGYDRGLSGGLGLKTGDGKFSIDYALENKPLSMNHRFTLSYRFIAPKAPAPRPAAEETDEDYARALARAQGLSQEHFLRGQGHFKEQSYGKALEPLRIAAALDPENSEKAAFYRRALEVARRDKLRLLNGELEAALGREDDPATYKAGARMLALRASDQERLASILRSVLSRDKASALDPAAAEILAERKARASRLESAGLLADALSLAEGLEPFRTSGTADGVAAFKADMSSGGRALRARLDSEAAEAEKAGAHGKASRALAELRRAFPQDAALEERADAARESARATLALKERLYLRRLYFLAAIQYANGNPEGAGDMLEEVLRRDPADVPAGRLVETMATAIVVEEELK